MRKKIITKHNKENKVNPNNFLSSGCTLLNLRLTGHPDCGWKKGCYHNIIGDSFAGKTILSWTALAEACNDKRFEKYLKIYNSSEGDVGFDIKELFGSKADREVIREKEGSKFSNSIYIEKWAKDFSKRLSIGKPFVEVMDSYDNLKCKEEEKKDPEARNYPSKPRILTEILRRNQNDLIKTESLAFIISHVRDNLDAALFASKKRRSGGRALKNYCETEIWLAAADPITKTFRKVKEEIGNNVNAKITKNRSSGRKGKIYFPLIIDYGVDDILSQINYLLKFDEWKRTSGKIKTPFGSYNKTDLIKKIEEDGLQNKLKKETTKLFHKVIKATKEIRKSKFK